MGNDQPHKDCEILGVSKNATQERPRILSLLSVKT